MSFFDTKFVWGIISSSSSVKNLIEKLYIVTVKELISRHCDFDEEWSPEIGRAIRWLETMFSPISVPPPFVEKMICHTPGSTGNAFFSIV
jgi:hypothetical protein